MMTRDVRWLMMLALLLVTSLAQAGTKHYYYTDPQGTVLAKADASGAIIATYDYAPYGTAVASMSPAPNGPGYTGHVNDPDTGLIYMQARYYDPIGRMLSVDPIGPTPGNVFTFNRYGYANNNPSTFTDPDGKKSVVRDGKIIILPEDKTVPPLPPIPNNVGAKGFDSSAFSFHKYNVVTPSSLTPQEAGDGLRYNPTPGQDMAASPGGTRNDVGNIPILDGSNYVRSYSLPSPDPTRFTAITVNYTIAGEHKLTEGFVMRYGEINSNGTVTLRSYGEGNNWHQNMLLKPIWDPQVQRVWQHNQREIIETMTGK